ncbi:hypothetical protein BN1013_01463 [Candidatus Rubidus massiliensis]|nr:hypothetical protein BN1013_01463 [Candidatus Rubidus massiliensis]
MKTLLISLFFVFSLFNLNAYNPSDFGKLPTIYCEDPWYTLLLQGTKPVEGKKGLPKYRSLQRGDRVIFVCLGQEDTYFFARVIKIDSFDSLDDYLLSVTLDKALPGIETLEEARTIYYQWSTEEDIQKYGFSGIWIEIE